VTGCFLCRLHSSQVCAVFSPLVAQAEPIPGTETWRPSVHVSPGFNERYLRGTHIHPGGLIRVDVHDGLWSTVTILGTRIHQGGLIRVDVHDGLWSTVTILRVHEGQGYFDRMSAEELCLLGCYAVWLL
jgi:hypothetical protein